ncbi:glycoside hydrolase family 95 protein [Streptomyces sp. MC1]|uniref:glycoside hydrolase family 95 protein n=1 Tax=Streptomyces sp. MC1 TaxID=295105 RepID=UPI0018C9B5BF|nr:glycoside hydrolase family 95 protein [Streptomyces sp. MC1]MBG7697733.1 glycoside hydrolase family 95 protein [Streptomyces sp. MC1]
MPAYSHGPAQTPHRLSFARPAGHWLEMLPLGNGRIGAMPDGGVERERVLLNDGTAWSGSPAGEFAHGRVGAATAREAVAEARRALAEGDHARADAAVRRLQERWTQAYLPFAELTVGVANPPGEITGYSRRLDLRTAEHVVRYEAGGAVVVRRTVVSHPDRALLMTIDVASGPGVDLTVGLDSPLRVLERGCGERLAWLTTRMPSDVAPPHEPDAPSPVYDDDRASLRGAVALHWSHDGEDVAAGEAAGTGPGGDPALVARGVRHAEIVLTTGTTFTAIGAEPRGDERDALAAARQDLDAAVRRGAAALRERQSADHAWLYQRVELEWDVPADERLRQLAFLFHYGRYLLISASRAGGPPATLQGLWNDSMRPPWSSNYTININTQMNYWPADVTDLPECLPPLFDLVEAVSVRGAETARRLYGARGWCAHHNTDVWAYTSPVGRGKADPAWAFWPLAGAWLCRHLADHVAFGAGLPFARERAWPIVRGAARFLLDWLVELPDGTLGFSPSSSPENRFITPTGPRAVDVSSAIDIGIAREVFTSATALAELAGQPDDLVAGAARAALGRLPGPEIDEDGTVREWRGPHVMAEPAHRHLSPLYEAFPGTGVRAEHATAVARTLDVRGDDSTGWSLAWKLALRARLRHTERLPALIDLALREVDPAAVGEHGGLYPNRLSAHPPFQIDGNFGFTAAIAECVLQSHAGTVDLLPALPSDWPAGRIRGLVARPGAVVDLAWDDERRLIEARLRRRSDRVGTVRVSLGDASVEVDLARGPWTVRPGAGGRLLAVEG